MARKEEIDWKSKYDREHAIRVAAEELIEQKSLELFEAQLSIEKYAEKLEYEQKEMQDSIRYGARILNRLLPNEYIIQSSFPSSRVFFAPRDIVGGDFYWTHRMPDGSVVLALSDCTGHGVPGAFMSIMGINQLNAIVPESIDSSPAGIIQRLDREITHILCEKNQSIGALQDGMDIAIIRWFPQKRKLFASSAHESVILQKADVVELLPTTRHSIGGNLISDKDYIDYEYELDGGSRLFMFSNGFYDQIGGPRRSKFGKRRVLELIEAHVRESFSSQFGAVVDAFHEWRGDQDQVDDVTFIGIELTT
ncbi:MAG: PP2C family protein-serine/threonine phosphatase [Sphingobacteriia bacterium]